MVLGGIEKSLLDLIYLLPKDQFEITLLLEQKKGGFLPYVPEYVKVCQLKYTEEDRMELTAGRVPRMKYALKKFHFKYIAEILWKRLKWIIKGRKYSFDYPAFDSILHRTPQIFDGQFDIAVAYFGDMMFSLGVVLNYINAKTKVCWTHSEHPFAQMNLALHKDYYSRFDYRFACSQATAARINNAIGEEIVKAVPHTFAVERMKKMAKYDANVFNRTENVPVVLTVARLDKQKGIDIAIEAHEKLLQKGIKHYWFVVGEGNGNGDEEKYHQMVTDKKLSESFIFLGGKDNPYPYFKECDIYVQPSRYEGYCITVAEARVFRTPIVATDFDGAREQLRDNETGFIVSCTVDAISESMENLLKSSALRNKFSDNLSKEKIDTQSEVLKLWTDLK